MWPATSLIPLLLEQIELSLIVVTNCLFYSFTECFIGEKVGSNKNRVAPLSDFSASTAISVLRK